MKNLKIIIIFLIILICIIGGVIFYMYNKNSDSNITENNETSQTNTENEEAESEETEGEAYGESDEEFSGLISTDRKCFQMEKIINDYYNLIQNNNSEKLYNLLSDKFKDDNKITEENVLSNLKLSSNFIQFKIEQAYQEIYENNQSTNIYYIYGKTYFSNQSQEGYFIISVDNNTNCYAITPLENTDNTKSSFENIIEKLNVNSDKTEQNINEDYYTVEKNDYNKFDTSGYDDLQMCNKYLEEYIFYAKYDIEFLYEKISDENKRTEFENLEQFETYIEQTDLENIKIYKYYAELEEDFSKYVIQDYDENYYVFEVTNANEYIIYLQ